MDADSILAPLNQQQRSAVTAPQGHWLVLAGAGCGKTRVLAHRIAWYIYTGQAHGHNVLAVTFTNKAAREMQGRIAQLLQQPTAGMWVGTFHGTAHRMLRTHREEAKLPDGFRILDHEDQRRIVRQVMQELNLDDKRWDPGRIQGFINARKEEGLRAQHLVRSEQTPAPMIDAYREYQQRCERGGLVDFAELLLRVHELLRAHPELLAHYHKRFPCLLIDEFQDTNALQYAWIRQLAGPEGSVFAVGDDDQSIYGWRGAKVENMLKFNQDFPGSRLLRLEKNYRSSGNILNAANCLIANNGGRLGKQLWTDQGEGELIELYLAYNERDEASHLAEEIQRGREAFGGLSEIAVLYRISAQSRAIEEAFIQASIPHRVYGGLRFYERQEIKDALAYLRLAILPQDDPSFERIVNVPPRGIGHKTIERLRELARRRQLALQQAAEDAIEHALLATRALKSLRLFLELIGDLRAKIQHATLPESISEVLRHSSLMEHYGKEKGELAHSRMENLQELLNAAVAFEENHDDPEMDVRSAFLAHSALEAGTNQSDDDTAYVSLMTLHSAKGLEFNKIFITGLEEGLLPHYLSTENPHQLEEERRLCYVGITRARRSLSLSRAENRRIYGKERYNSPSRFLQELPEALLRCTSSSGMNPRGGLPLPSSPIELQIGQQVVHGEFGTGVVIAFERFRGGGTRVQIHFEHTGHKWLLTDNCPLWPVSG